MKIRHDILTKDLTSEPKVVLEKVTLIREMADFLRRNVVQARKVPDEPTSDGSDRWRKSLTLSNASRHLQVNVELGITEHTELGSNDSIKNPSQSSRSARKQERAQ